MADLDAASGNIVRQVDFDEAILRDIKLICDRYGFNYSDHEGFGNAIGAAIGLLACALNEIPKGSEHRLLVDRGEDRPWRIIEIPR